MAGYSNTPLHRKLGIKTGYRVYMRNPPSNFRQMLEPLPDGVRLLSRLSGEVDMIHFFTCNARELEKGLLSYITQIKRDGMIWVSWPKKSSGVQSEITEDDIRRSALPMGLVDVKVCAVDKVWSGLKLVIRKELR